MKVILALTFVALANAAPPPLTGCGEPACTNTTLHYPHVDPRFFWQCAPEAGCDAWKAKQMPCKSGQWFSYKDQACVRCWQWENLCGINPVPECDCEEPDPIETPELPPLTDCGVPHCYNTTILFPHIDPEYFWQCNPEAGCDDWIAMKRPCAPGTRFSYKNQVCVHCQSWENPCRLDPAPECECLTTERPTTVEIIEPPPNKCNRPACYKTELLFPNRDPTRFWQCAPVENCDEWTAVEKVCPDGLYFSYKHQVCDWCNDHVCDIEPIFGTVPKCP